MTPAMLTDTVLSAPSAAAMLAQSSISNSVVPLAYFGIIGAVGLLLLFFVVLIIKQYKRCPSNRILVVYGKVDKEGKKKNLTLSISARGKRTQKFEIDYKSADAKSFKKELRGELNRRLAGAERDDSNNDDDEDEKPKREDKREAKRDDDGDKVRKRRDRDDDDDDRPRKKKRHAINHAALRISAGGVAARRTLTYDAGGMAPPPRVGTFGGAGRIDAELYPAAFDSLKGPAAGIGFAGEFEKTLGVSIDVPGTAKSTPINQMRYSVGARYRVVFGPSSFAFGASYWYRQFVADRSSLSGLEGLDMPEVDSIDADDIYEVFPVPGTAYTARPFLPVSLQWHLVGDLDGDGEIVEGSTDGPMGSSATIDAA